MTRSTPSVDDHVPIRRCLGCGARRPRADLARFVLRPAPGGHVLVADARGRADGRGLYTCASHECFERARRRRAFARAGRASGPVAVADVSPIRRGPE